MTSRLRLRPASSASSSLLVLLLSASSCSCISESGFDFGFDDVPVGYECKSDGGNWAAFWSPEEQQWCCKHKGLGCVKKEPPQTTPPPEAYECKVQSKVQTPISGPARNICLAYGFSSDGLRMVACKAGDAQTWSWQGERLRLEYNYKCLSHGQGGRVSLGACSGSDAPGGAHATAWTMQGTKLQPSSAPSLCLTRSEHPADAPTLAACDGGEAQVWSLKQPTGWAPKEAEWCCRKRSIGCQTTSRNPETTTTRLTTSTTMTPTTTLIPASGTYRCTGSDPKAWSAAQLLWCCLNGHPEVDASCPKHVSSLPKESYDCVTGREDWRHLWPAQQQTWCCVHEAVGCTLESLLPEVPTTGQTGPVESLEEKQEEEAEAFGVLETLEHAGASGAGASDAVPGVVGAGVTVGGQREYASRSSPSSGSRVTFNCLGSAPATWTVEKRLHCCSFEEIGCPQVVRQPSQQQQQQLQSSHPSSSSSFSSPSSSSSSRSSAPILGGTGFGGYDCRKEAVASWTKGKRSWCCDRQGLGCDPCDENQNPSQADRERCCRTENRLCEARTTVPANFDCSSGLAWSWSNEKALYCCRHEQRGCEFLPDDVVDRLHSDRDASSLGRSAGEALLAVIVGPWQWIGNLLGFGGEDHSSHGNAPLSTTASFSDVLTTTTQRYDTVAATTTTTRPEYYSPALSQGQRQRQRQTPPAPMPTPAPMPMNTQASSSSAVTFQCFSGDSSSWSSRQLAWCCIHYGKGCEVLSQSMPGSLFTCTDARAMSVGKATWCCKHEQRLCDAPEAGHFGMKYETHRPTEETGSEAVRRAAAFAGLLGFAGMLAGVVVWRHHRYRCHNACSMRRRGLRMMEVLDYEFEEVVLL